jgi:NHL repeat
MWQKADRFGKSKTKRPSHRLFPTTFEAVILKVDGGTQIGASLQIQWCTDLGFVTGDQAMSLFALISPSTLKTIRAFSLAMLAVPVTLALSPATALAGATVTTLVGDPNNRGSDDGTGQNATFTQPVGIVLIDPYLYIASRDQTIRQVHVITKVVTTIAGNAFEPHEIIDGQGADARFENIYGLGKDRDGNLYVAEFTKHVIRKIKNPAGTAIVSTIAGTGSPGYADTNLASVPPTVALFRNPVGVAGDPAGDTVFVADRLNFAIRKILQPSNVVSTIAGAQPGGNIAGFTDSNDLGKYVYKARFYSPLGIVVDPSESGDIFVTDGQNHAIRHLEPNGYGGYFVTTIAGGFPLPGTPARPWEGRSGFNTVSAGAVPGTSALFNEPWDIDVDDAGNLYVADRVNNAIRMLTKNNNGDYDVTTIAGLGPNQAGHNDGDETDSLFNNPYGLAVDPSGCNIYVSDLFNSAIRKIERCEVDLEITKEAIGSGCNDDSICVTTFKLTIGGNNAGLQTGDQISVTDQLPGGLTFLAISAPGWTCQPSPIGSSNLRCYYILGAFPPEPILVTVEHQGAFNNCATVMAERNGAGIVDSDPGNNTHCVNDLGALEIKKEVVASHPETAATYAALISGLNDPSNTTTYDVKVKCGGPSQIVALTAAGYFDTAIAAGTNCQIKEQNPTVSLPKFCKWLPPVYPDGQTGIITKGGVLTLAIRNTIDCPTQFTGGPGSLGGLGSKDPKGGGLTTKGPVGGSSLSVSGNLKITKTVIAGNAFTVKNYAALIKQLNDPANNTAYDVDVNCGGQQQTVQATITTSAVVSSVAAGITCAIEEQPPTAPLPKKCKWGPPEYPNGNSGVITSGGLALTIQNSIDCTGKSKKGWRFWR